MIVGEKLAIGARNLVHLFGDRYASRNRSPNMAGYHQQQYPRGDKAEGNEKGSSKLDDRGKQVKHVVILRWIKPIAIILT